MFLGALRNARQGFKSCEKTLYQYLPHMDHNDKLTLRKRYARMNILKYRYFHRVVCSWDSLPEYYL